MDNETLKDDVEITVCAKCLQASCWHGEFMCEEALESGITTKTVGELRKLKFKDPDNWEHEDNWRKQVYGEI